jgi:hypothetical protein
MGTPRKRGIEKEGARRMEGSDGMKETDGHKDTRNGGGKAWRDEAHVRDGMEGRKAGRRDGAEKHRGKRGRGRGRKEIEGGGTRSTHVMGLLDHPTL